VGGCSCRRTWRAAARRRSGTARQACTEEYSRTRSRKVGIGTGVGGDLDVLAENRPVGSGGGPVGHAHRVALGPGQQRLVPCPLHAHGPVGSPCRQRHVRLDGHVLLPPETPPDVGSHHPTFDSGQPGSWRRRGSARRLGWPRGMFSTPSLFEPAHAGFGLEVGVVDVLGVVLALDHDVAAQKRHDRAPVDVPLRQEVAVLVHNGASARAPPRGRRRRAPPRSRSRRAGHASASTSRFSATNEGDRLAMERDVARWQHFHARPERATRTVCPGTSTQMVLCGHVLPEKDLHHAGSSERVTRHDGRSEPTAPGTDEAGVQHPGQAGSPRRRWCRPPSPAGHGERAVGGPPATRRPCEVRISPGSVRRSPAMVASMASRMGP